MDFDAVLGPLGALVLAVLALMAFVTEKVTPGSRTKRAEDLAKAAVEGWQAEQRTADTLVKAFEERNAIERRRQALAKKAGG